MKFYAKGKLLLTAEYAVLGGAKALGLPTKLGQYLDVTKTTKAKIEWKSIDVNGQVWYENSFDKTTFAPQSLPPGCASNRGSEQDPVIECA